MTTRRQSMALLGALAAGLPAGGARGAYIARIGYLTTGTAASNEGFLRAFRDALRDLGYVDGRNIAIDVRFAGDNAGLFPQLATSLVDERVDLIVGTCIPSTRAAKNATSTTPIVMSVDGDPVRADLVASLARPGGNVTGMSTWFEALIGKWLEFLLEAAPTARTIALLSNPDNVTHLYFSAKFDEAAQRKGVSAAHVSARVKEDLEPAFAEMRRRKADALVVMTEASVAGHEGRIVPLAARYRLPAIYGFREFVEAGGLMSYGVSYRDYFREVAQYVDAVLRGGNPAEMPVQQPRRIELVINLKTAQALGLTIPQALVIRADKLLA